MSARIDNDDGDGVAGEDPVLVEWAAEIALLMRGGQSIDWDALHRRDPEHAEALRCLQLR